MLQFHALTLKCAVYGLQVAEQDLEAEAEPRTIALPPRHAATRTTRRGPAQASEAELRLKAGDVCPDQHASILQGSARGTIASSHINITSLKRQRWTLAAFEYRLDSDSDQHYKPSQPVTLSNVPSQSGRVSFGSIGDSPCTSQAGKCFDTAGTYQVRLCLGQTSFAPNVANLTVSQDNSQEHNLPGAVQTIRSKWFKVIVEEPTLLHADSCCILNPPQEIMRGTSTTLRLACKRGDRFVSPTLEEVQAATISFDPMTLRYGFS